MLISKRRLLYSIVILLMIGCAALVSPIRSWLVGSAVRNGIDPNMSVRELVFHSSKSVLEARDVSWRGATGSRRLGIAARRGWFALDNLALLHRNFRFPKVILQDARIHLDDVQSPMATDANIWDLQVDARISRLDWHKIHRHFNSLHAANELIEAWSGRLEHYTNRAGEILAQAEAVESEAAPMDNPLRFEDCVRAKMERVGELADEQQLLIRQFDGIKRLLSAETRRVSKLGQQDLVRLGAVVSEDPPESDVQDQQSLCTALAEDFARRIWKQVSPYAEVVDRLGQVTFVRPAAAGNGNLRVSQNELSLVDFAEVKASGSFENGSRRTPFDATGTWSLIQDRNLRKQLQFDGAFAFLVGPRIVNISSSYDSRVSESTQIQLLVSEPTIEKTGKSSITAIVTSLEGRLEGTLTLDVQAMGPLQLAPRSRMSSLPNSPDIGSDRVQFQLAGSWASPQIRMMGGEPAWLEPVVKMELDRELEPAVLAVRSRLDDELRTRLARLGQLVERAVQQGEALAQSHRPQLVAIQERLRLQLKDSAGNDFARQAASVHR